MGKNVEEAIRKIVAEKSNLEKSKELGLHDNLQDFGINSITFMKIVVGIEKEFGMKFDDEILSFENFQTLQSIVEYIEGKL